MDVGIAFGHAAGGMAGDELDEAEVAGTVIQFSEGCMPEHVRMDGPCDARLPGEACYQLTDVAGVQGFAWPELTLGVPLLKALRAGRTVDAPAAADGAEERAPSDAQGAALLLPAFEGLVGGRRQGYALACLLALGGASRQAENPEADGAAIAGPLLLADIAGLYLEGFTATEAGLEHKLEEGEVSGAGRCAGVDLAEEGLGFLLLEDVGLQIHFLGPLEGVYYREEYFSVLYCMPWKWSSSLR